MNREQEIQRLMVEISQTMDEPARNRRLRKKLDALMKQKIMSGGFFG